MKTFRPWWKKLLFGLFTTVLFFAALEGILRLSGVSAQIVLRDPFVEFAPGIPLFEQERDDNGRVVLATSRQKLTWFNKQTFPKNKLPNTYRIFCVGGSTTYGRPYDDLTSYPGWMRELLAIADSSREWEVINAGGISYASYRVAAVMEELTGYQPDLFVVYCGHNEFLEERTYRDVKRKPSSLLKLRGFLNRTQTYAALNRLLSPLTIDRGEIPRLPGEVDAVLDHTTGPELYHRDDRLQRQILDHYEFNLARMITIARSVDAGLLFITPASNLKDASPFKSEQDQTLSREEADQWKRLYDKANKLETAGEIQDALRVYREAAAIDSHFADLHFRMGTLLFRQQRFDEALLAFQHARDEDVCPLRALTEMSAAFKNLDRHDGVWVLDFESLVKEKCFREQGHRIPGEEYFFDHVHPVIATNRSLAKAIVERMMENGMIRKSSSWNEETITTAAERIEGRIDRRSHAMALRNLAKVLTWAGKHTEAGPPALKALSTLPDDRECLFMAGTYFRKQGEAEKSFSYFSRSLKQSTDAADIHLELAKRAVSEAKIAQARLHYDETLRLRPGDKDAQQGLSAIGNR